VHRLILIDVYNKYVNHYIVFRWFSMSVVILGCSKWMNIISAKSDIFFSLVLNLENWIKPLDFFESNLNKTGCDYEIWR
jgi:hypothetical protein